MKPALRFLVCVLGLITLSACASIAPDVPVVSSGTPERNDANPGLADSPYAPLTGAQPRKY
ncbi:MAG: hypothetical protein INR62_05680 [Rhodospirillales bacterium]|nr:hypothetical protein [Acetobacter sp.]